jgi:hypothetical protein
MDHPFFAEIDWTSLYNKTIKAPYLPEIRTDLNNSLASYL